MSPQPRRTPLSIVLGGLAAAGILAVTGCSQSSGTQTGTESATGSGSGCRYQASGDAAKQVEPPSGEAPTTGTLQATITIDGKPVTVSMDRAKAPCTVHNFESLAKQGYFVDTRCHRMLNAGGFVLQCGDPSGTGSGGPGYSFPDELTGEEKYTAGTVAMANAGPDTNGSQFFLVYQESGFQPDYTVFGQMDAAGVKVVSDIAAQGLAADKVGPAAPAKISTVALG